jgi:acyl carrier protein
MTRKHVPASRKKKKIEYILTLMKNEMPRIILVDMSSIDEDASFLDIGINSVFSVDLIHNLNEALSIELGVENIFDYTTPRLLAEHIVSGYGKDINSSEKKKQKQHIHQKRKKTQVKPTKKKAR